MKKKTYSLEQKAKMANEKDRMCGKCNHYPCPDALSNVCSEAFVRGFKKGYRQVRNEQEQKISSILHDASGNAKLSITLDYNSTVCEVIIKREGKKMFSELNRSEQLDVLKCLSSTEKTLVRFLKEKEG